MYCRDYYSTTVYDRYPTEPRAGMLLGMTVALHFFFRSKNINFKLDSVLVLIFCWLIPHSRTSRPRPLPQNAGNVA
jgi:hypothetical protein